MNEVVSAPGSPAAPVEKSKTPIFDKLTAKQKKFCEAYLICMNATEAAVRAGYGKDRKVAGVLGHETLKNPKIATALIELAELNPKITQTRIIDEWAAMGFSDIQDYAEWDGSNFTLKSKADLPAGASRAIKKISRTWGKSSSMSIEFHDKHGALTKLAEFYKMTNAVKEGGNVNVNIQNNQQNNVGDTFVRAPILSRDDWEKSMIDDQREQRERDEAAADAAAGHPSTDVIRSRVRKITTRNQE